MDFLKGVGRKISSMPFLSFLMLIFIVYVLGFFQNQHNLIAALETSKSQVVTLQAQMKSLQKEVAHNKEYFIPPIGSLCIKKTYDERYMTISATNTENWCNVRFYMDIPIGDKGYDIWFPSSYTADTRGAYNSTLVVFDRGNAAFTIMRADATGKSINTYDKLEPFSESMLKEPITSRKIMQIHESDVLFVTTSNEAGYVFEHYIFDNGGIKQKTAYIISFYTMLSQEQKEVILNSFSPRFH
ncbi:hypothetical protein KAZ66_05570 [Candidatus Woesebacteria bacterium]|nr:hypothetical protein [Candidatus Woesebacteria bacterium]